VENALAEGALVSKGDWDEQKLGNPREDEAVEVTQLEDGRCTIHVELPPAGMIILS